MISFSEHLTAQPSPFLCCCEVTQCLRQADEVIGVNGDTSTQQEGRNRRPPQRCLEGGVQSGGKLSKGVSQDSIMLSQTSQWLTSGIFYVTFWDSDWVQANWSHSETSGKGDDNTLIDNRWNVHCEPTLVSVSYIPDRSPRCFLSENFWNFLEKAQV